MSIRIVRVPPGSELVSAARAEPAAWVRAVGRLSQAALRASDGQVLALQGDLLLVSLEGAADRSLFALIQQQDALGTRLIAGELLSADVVSAPVDLCLMLPAPEAASEPAALSPVRSAPPAPISAPNIPPAAASEPSFARAMEASAERGVFKLGQPSAQGLAQAIPQRPARPQLVEDEPVLPEPGDRVEHFAFGTCEVLKSEDERLHLRLGKNGAIKEIAVQMLRVSLLPDDGAPGRRFKLERRL